MALSKDEQAAFDKLKADWLAVGNATAKEVEEAAVRENRGFSDVLMERAIGRPLTTTEKFAYLCGRVQGEKAKE